MEKNGIKAFLMMQTQQGEYSAPAITNQAAATNQAATTAPVHQAIHHAAAVTNMLKPNQNENPDYNRTPNQQKRLREKLERDTKKFLKQGGKIQKLPPGLRSESAPQDAIDYEP